jgi:signal transduction histidine kinase
MKIVYKNILVNSLISIFVLILGGLVLFQYLKSNLDTAIVEDLYVQQNFIKKRLNSGVSIELLRNNLSDNVNVKNVVTIKHKEPVIENEESYDLIKHSKQKIKKIIFDVEQNKKYYQITITKISNKNDGVEKSMENVMITTGISMLVLLMLINIYVYYTLYSPFYKIVKSIGKFSLQKLEKIAAPKTNTEEFEILGKKISQMSEKMIGDYNSMKEFIENMTHETQTPLAVINTKIERCIQNKDLTSEQSVLLSDAAKAVKKLFDLNKGLALLSKLDNKQYNSPKEIKVKELVQQRVYFFADFIENQEITLEENYIDDTSILIDLYLAEILIDNLLKNAVKHNFHSGKILITVANNQITIANTGAEPTESTDRFFDRFYSQKPQQNLGLGLSIIKKIVDYYNYSISYKYVNHLHEITINFKNV